jgi:hypothetical protein
MVCEQTWSLATHTMSIRFGLKTGCDNYYTLGSCIKYTKGVWSQNTQHQEGSGKVISLYFHAYVDQPNGRPDASCVSISGQGHLGLWVGHEVRLHNFDLDWTREATRSTPSCTRPSLHSDRGSCIVPTMTPCNNRTNVDAAPAPRAPWIPCFNLGLEAQLNLGQPEVAQMNSAL